MVTTAEFIAFDNDSLCKIGFISKYVHQRKVSIVYVRKNEMVILCCINNRFMSIIVMISSPDWAGIKLDQLCLLPHSSYGCDDLWPCLIPHITIRKISSCWMLKIIHSGYYWTMMVVDSEAGVVTQCVILHFLASCQHI